MIARGYGTIVKLILFRLIDKSLILLSLMYELIAALSFVSSINATSLLTSKSVVASTKASTSLYWRARFTFVSFVSFTKSFVYELIFDIKTSSISASSDNEDRYDALSFKLLMSIELSKYDSLRLLAILNVKLASLSWETEIIPLIADELII